MDIPIHHSSMAISPSVIIQEAAFWRGDTRTWVQRQALRLAVDDEIGENEQKDITTSVYFVDNTHNQTLYRYRIDKEYYAASVNKLPITLLLLEDLRSGKLALDDKIELPAERIEGAGKYDEDDRTREITLGQALEDMLKRSGNTVVRALVAELGGAEKVNERLAQDKNLRKTRLIDRGSDGFWLGNTTARESLDIMNRVAEKQDVYGKFVQKALTDNVFDDFGVKAQHSSSYIVLTNKMGQLSDEGGDVRHDVGIIHNTRTGERYSFAILNSAKSEFLINDEKPIDPIQAIGRHLFNFVKR